jgi:hypothetical protein
MSVSEKLISNVGDTLLNYDIDTRYISIVGGLQYYIEP